MAAGLHALGFVTGDERRLRIRGDGARCVHGARRDPGRDSAPAGRSGRARGISLAAALAFWGFAASIFTFSAATATPLNSLLAQLIYVPGLVAMTLMTIELTRRMGRLRIAGLEAAIGGRCARLIVWALVLEPTIDQSAGSVSIASIVYPVVRRRAAHAAAPRRFLPAARIARGPVARRRVAPARHRRLPVLQPTGRRRPSSRARIINALYIAAYMSFGAAALHRSMRRLPARRPFADDVHVVAPRRHPRLLLS